MGFGVYASSGENYGVYGRADLSTNKNIGVLGLSEGSSSQEWGVSGSYQGSGAGDNAGTRGYNNNPNTASNDNFGVKEMSMLEHTVYQMELVLPLIIIM